MSVSRSRAFSITAAAMNHPRTTLEGDAPLLVSVVLQEGSSHRLAWPPPVESSSRWPLGPRRPRHLVHERGMSRPGLPIPETPRRALAPSRAPLSRFKSGPFNPRTVGFPRGDEGVGPSASSAPGGGHLVVSTRAECGYVSRGGVPLWPPP